MSEVLYFSPVCPISHKIRILLKLSRLNIEQICVASFAYYKKLNLTEKLPILKPINLRFAEQFLLYLYKNDNIAMVKEWFDNGELQSFELMMDREFFYDVYFHSVYDKFVKPLYEQSFVSSVQNHILKKQHNYLTEFNTIFSKQPWVQYKKTINDITLFSHLAALDYNFQIPWFNYPDLKKWYSRMKSQADFNFILQSRAVILPPQHYELIDF